MERNYDWNRLKDLPELTWIPDRYDVEDKILFRSPLYMINHLMWNQLRDYDFYNSLNLTDESIITVHGYYTASVHHLHRLKTILIPANTRLEESIVVRNFSRLRENSNHAARLEGCFTSSCDGSLKNYIENLHRVDSLDKYCSSEMQEVVIDTPQDIVAYDRVMAVWVVDLILGLYREDNMGKISLVGCSDYLVDVTSQVYPRSNNYWSDRLFEERDSKPVSKEERRCTRIYIPDPAYDNETEHV